MRNFSFAYIEKYTPSKQQLRTYLLKKYLKASILAGMQSYAIYKFIGYNNNEQIAKRNTYAWWSLGLYFYGIIDAYVDYNLKNFPKENNDNDE